jgi:N-acetylmuramoyl-L-alanine amidase
MDAVDTMSRGARGDAVRDVQGRLASLGYHLDPSEHGWLGPSTEEAIRAFQQRRQLLVDGVLGEETWQELVEAGYAVGDRILYLRLPFFRGDDVRSLQAGLNLLGFDAGKEDGIFGSRTEQAVLDFQRNVGMPSDGIVGATTIEALRRLRPVGAGPGRAAVREAEALRRLSATLRGARIAIDPGHGPGDPGATGASGTTEAGAAILLAGALAEELERRGATPFLLRQPESTPSPGVRARAAIELGPEIVLSLLVNSHEDPAAEGASTYYYGREGWFSQAGQRLADSIQHELIEQLGLTDGRSHPKALQLLRETQMPAVHVEPCFVTNPEEEALLADEGFRRRLAKALADAIESFFGNRVSSGGSGGASEGDVEPMPNAASDG